VGGLITGGVNNNSIHIEFPTGYSSTETTVINLDGTPLDEVNIHFFPLYDMVTIDLANDLTAGAHTIAITDIQNPTA